MSRPFSVKLEEEQESHLWAEFASTGKADIRDKLVEHYQSYARTIAAHIYAKQFVKDVEFDDYLHIGLVGLLEAIDRYDVERGINFRTYAGYRIRGAIYSGLVKFSEKRAQEDRWQELRQDRINSLTQGPKEEHLFEELVTLTVSIALGYIIEIDNPAHTQNRAQTPYENRHFDELSEQVNSLITQLPEKEQLVIRYHYYHQVEFHAVSDILQISPARVSQLHKRALIRIREILKTKQHLNASY